MYLFVNEFNFRTPKLTFELLSLFGSRVTKAALIKEKNTLNPSTILDKLSNNLAAAEPAAPPPAPSIFIATAYKQHVGLPIDTKANPSPPLRSMANFRGITGVLRFFVATTEHPVVPENGCNGQGRGSSYLFLQCNDIWIRR